ncbi:F0F1 ATP synthase subunit delta [Moraxella sp. FZLJ2107]|uniref:F0F1 ATP synthase subunit delta n=1 Tax=unclassified Moraxella TaxID=2685852 RepID=UPI00209C1506|nr:MULTISPECIES: F0F1 ATP synthase subunit delta [unclassified Moraxella]USZ15375.1 F0F1 ATP synthase subunit delta [Moraxella sp. FZFQ2102]UTO06106.1 F0F1 ATP synthase subunit delta [Moraxella sp. FZLJ2107]UTO22843.1 F0F1 ATP synthase subunit delta [Moraxella sp. FZLJ2109]
MAELSTLARPYAKAAFDYAKEQNVINNWETFLSVASSIVSNEEFASLLNNPAISADQKADVLLDAYNKISAEEASLALANFTKQLAGHDRLALLPEIHAHYSKLKSQELKQVDAYVTSAYPLTEAQRKNLQERLAVSTGSIVILHEEVNPELLGGATIKVGDKFTDGSVRGKLKQLKTQLTA